jgi:hypothetical protein
VRDRRAVSQCGKNRAAIAVDRNSTVARDGSRSRDEADRAPTGAAEESALWSRVARRLQKEAATVLAVQLGGGRGGSARPSGGQTFLQGEFGDITVVIFFTGWFCFRGR